MDKPKNILSKLANYFWNNFGIGIRTKLIILFLSVSIIPLILLILLTLQQFGEFINHLAGDANNDAATALNNAATENIERITTDTARAVADFLYARDSDILYLSNIGPSEENYRAFIGAKQGLLMDRGAWELAPDGKSWIPVSPALNEGEGGISTNSENNDLDGFRYRRPDTFTYKSVPLYDEISYIDMDGNELIKVTADPSTKIHYPLSNERKNVSIRENTYIRAETYFRHLSGLTKGDIYVSDVIGAYVGSNYIGMYTPGIVSTAAEARGYDIPYDPENQAYAGEENPNGRRFEGIIRWVTPVTDKNGQKTGYVTLALNHDHIMEFVDHITPMVERYTELPSAFEGNYAFIWDYQCRSIAHPRHHSIVGFDPETGDPQIPWLESSIYDKWQESGIEKWTDFIVDWPKFDRQSRRNIPSPLLTRAGLVGLDGRYLNNAPQCTGWMDLSEDGGSGSFYILWSGLYKLTTVAAIPYYTGKYAPSYTNNYSRRGFGIVTIGAGMDYFTSTATAIGEQLRFSMGKNLDDTIRRSILTFVITAFFVTFIAIKLASFLTKNITGLINGLARFRAGERQFRFNAPIKDEFGTLADAFDSMADNIVDSVNSPLTIIGMDHRIIYMNQHGLDLYKKSLSDVVGTFYGLISLYPPGTKYCPVTSLENGIEAEVLFYEPTNRYYKGVANYFLDKNGKKIGFIISSVDVTEIQLAKDAADHASRAKGDFLSNMSHEIRTPLNAIIGMTSMGTSAVDIGRKDYCLNKIDDASKHLLGVINDILDMSKIEANKLELSFVKFNFEKMIQRVIDVIAFRIDEKKQRLNVHIDKNIPLMIISDELRLAQVITNLLSNAVKFTLSGGSIGLDVRLVSIEKDVCIIQTEVADSGIGISKEQMPRLFRAFEQAERSTSRKFGGTGLGLAISKRIIEMLDGKIWVESSIGKGSVFSFIIKAKYGDEDKDTLLNPELDKKNIRIIAVDDDQEIRDYFVSFGEQVGIVCDVAASGKEALDLINRNGHYDLYFIDWKMPEMNGIELSRIITDKVSGNSIIVMISSIEWIVIETEAKSAGVNSFLSKPLFTSTIANCINEHLGKSGMSETGKETDNFENYHILLAEDVDINREIVIALLEPTSIKIDCAENGLEAVRFFYDNPGKYDMIFMDLQMPEVDGLEATRRIRAMDIPESAQIPIIAMTANVFREDIDNCLAAGMNDHVGKPLDLEEVLDKLRRYLPENKTSRYMQD